MGGNGFKGAETGRALGGAIATNDVLTALDLSCREGAHDFSKCDPEFFRAFSSALVRNKALEALHIGNNFLGAEGTKHLASMLRVNTTLKKLIVDSFPLSVQEIRTNRQLDFSGEELSSLDVHIIASLLALNVSA